LKTTLAEKNVPKTAMATVYVQMANAPVIWSGLELNAINSCHLPVKTIAITEVAATMENVTATLDSKDISVKKQLNVPKTVIIEVFVEIPSVIVC